MFDQLVCRVMFHKLRYEGIFTPPSEKGTLVFPGNLSMFEWGGVAVDPQHQAMIANPMALPFVSRLIPRSANNPIEPKKSKSSSFSSVVCLQPPYGVPYGVTLEAFFLSIWLTLQAARLGIYRGRGFENPHYYLEASHWNRTRQFTAASCPSKWAC